MNIEPVKPASGFPDVKQVIAALVRAAQRARQVAEQTGTALIVTKPAAQSVDPKPSIPPIIKGG